MDDRNPWVEALQTELGKIISEARTGQKMSAVKLSEATAQLGVPIHRIAITRIEKGEQSPTVPEMVALAVALKEDWIGWLIRATNGIDVGGVLHAYSDWRTSLTDIGEQLTTAKRNLQQVDWAIKNLRMPDRLRQQREADRQRYEETVTSLRQQYAEFVRLLDEGDYLRPEDSTHPLARAFQDEDNPSA
ncbi:helix-turn-helix domain-containing protein [Mycolicibacterium fortuitum]|uniref:HTH cro/C1-type domain-containing protein n=1 Tax=Mycolicibacterium fortuitum subsp. fortuitum DSM 46621 = ATCC 6841 = JCM 6387 TaxID=1214102 RepID=K0V752_MYCFO|nr:helix-turn-helix transcriptional regulator [Mycolicibacterium fortuitum]CRL72369.1 hypothetical protein CPGR_00908 [Mycolicibacter nonchromogenicus]EJZ14992.1 hypothetical protein MFORT_06817 [Mycolicibacterium fortuitum subsp. fortuitum DSM 46621 = ATCC 6841 = JCM 6387]WEV32303.1 helix-turn-helix domain-containing protein [Mycolicibacterium fortuitum]CRL56564.1 hypothetical protein CPGR_03887 [Mycolicibacterium fortuitum subsp. fortuitum DSM 46621 = ATCC 6841 = JCM 6387]BDE01475.1 hypothet